MPENQYAETAVVIVTVTLLAVGSFAMLVRVFLNRRQQIAGAARQIVADVKEGQGLHLPSKSQALPSVSGTTRLRFQQWLDLVNRQPDRIPHLFIEGGSGAGKTTLATAILHDRRDQVAIVGVKPDDGWGDGYVYRSTEREAYLVALLREVRRRLDEDDRSGFTLVLDDFTRLAAQHKVALDLYKEVADVGRSLRIRLILIARGRQVKGIGASGESDLLEHFCFLHVSRDHGATLELDEVNRPIDTGMVCVMARPLPPERWLEVSTDSGISEVDEVALVRLLGLESGPVRAVHTDVPEDVPGGVPATLTPEAIKILYDYYQSKNRVAQFLTGTKAKRLAIIDAALEQDAAQAV